MYEDEIYKYTRNIYIYKNKIYKYKRYTYGNMYKLQNIQKLQNINYGIYTNTEIKDWNDIISLILNMLQMLVLVLFATQPCHLTSPTHLVTTPRHSALPTRLYDFWGYIHNILGV